MVMKMSRDFCSEHVRRRTWCYHNAIHITLNGKAFHLQKDMQVKDLADDLVKKFPFFKIYR
jgi:hypothetical protein